MPAYSSFGGLDDQILSDGDAVFVGMNQRLQPNQLKAGEVVLSKNGRIDGYWQPRKGLELRSGALTNSAQPLILPFSPQVVGLLNYKDLLVVSMFSQKLMVD
jgi:hypothetical protein